VLRPDSHVLQREKERHLDFAKNAKEEGREKRPAKEQNIPSGRGKTGGFVPVSEGSVPESCEDVRSVGIRPRRDFGVEAQDRHEQIQEWKPKHCINVRKFEETA